MHDARLAAARGIIAGVLGCRPQDVAADGIGNGIKQ